MQIESTFDLSEDEYKKVKLHADRLFASWNDTTECEREVVEAALGRMFERERCLPPHVFWCHSMKELEELPAQYAPVEENSFYQNCAASPVWDPITNAFTRALSKANLTWPASWQMRVMQIIGGHRVARWRESSARARLLLTAKMQADELGKDAPPHNICWGRWAGDLLPVYATPALALASGDWGQELLAQLADLFTIRSGAFAYVFRDHCVFVCENPVRVNVDEQERLHCFDGPALEFADGYSLYAWSGVYVDSQLVLNPESLTAARIDEEENVELRRVMLDRYGVQRYLEETGAAIVAEDDCGVLVRKEVPGDEPILMVKVVNSTAEPDGTYKEYFLRVPPHVESAREGVAWTFGMEMHEYAPSRES